MYRYITQYFPFEKVLDEYETGRSYMFYFSLSLLKNMFSPISLEDQPNFSLSLYDSTLFLPYISLASVLYQQFMVESRRTGA